MHFHYLFHLLSRAAARKLHTRWSRYKEVSTKSSFQLLMDIQCSSWIYPYIWIKLVNKTHPQCIHGCIAESDSISINSSLWITLTCETTPSLLEYVGINRRNIGSMVSWRGVIFLKNRISNTIRRRSTVIIPFLKWKWNTRIQKNSRFQPNAPC